MKRGVPLEFEEDLVAGKSILEDEIEIDVKAFGASFRDSLILSRGVESNGLGLEVAGTVT